MAIENEQPQNYTVPAAPNPLIGRGKELPAICQTICREEVRLLTLSGTGGTGKSRLALAVASALKDDFRDGVFFIALSGLKDAKFLIPTLAHALSIKEHTGQTLQEVFFQYLEKRQMLIILDNFEQLDEAAGVLRALLDSAPALKFLITSRVVLHLYGEWEYRVPPLTLPPTQYSLFPEKLMEYESVQLFLQRANAMRSDFKLTPENAPIIAEICRRLDGLPLALELAAPLLKLFSAEELLSRLGKRLEILTSGPLDFPERHRKLSATLDWSYTLLKPEAQSLFAQLGIFSGGATLPAIEAVASPTNSLLELLTLLIDHSLVLRQEGAEGQSRYSLLDTVREYALEKLKLDKDYRGVWQRFAAYYVQMAEEAEPHLRGSAQALWLNRLEAEHANFRAILLWAIETKAAETGWRLSGSLWLFWSRRGYITEGRKWLEQALAISQAGSEIARTIALNGAGNMALLQGDAEEAYKLHSQSLALRRQLGDKAEIALSLNNQGTAALNLGNKAEAEKLMQESLAITRLTGAAHLTARTLTNLGLLSLQNRNFTRAEEYLEESLRYFRQVGDKRAISLTLNNLGEVATFQGDYAKAATLHKNGLKLCEELGDISGMAFAYHNLGFGAACLGEFILAEQNLREALSLFEQTGDKKGIATTTSNLGLVFARTEQFVEATKLSYEAMHLRQELNDTAGLAYSFVNLGYLARAMAEYDKAISLYLRGLKEYKSLDDKLGMAQTLEGLLLVLWKAGKLELCAELYGTSQILRDELQVKPYPIDETELKLACNEARAGLGEALYIEMEQQGAKAAQSLSFEYVSNKVTELKTPPKPVHKPNPDGLTERQVEVLRLVAQGLTSVQIAEKLVLSPLTINSYLRTIYSKLGINSRSAATRYALDHNLV